MNVNFKFTLKAWPVIAVATIGLCFLTKTVAGWFGVDIPDQQNVELVRQWGIHCFDSLRNFFVFALLLAQVVVLLPAVEELLFRWLLFMLPVRFVGKRLKTIDVKQGRSECVRKIQYPVSVVSSALFSAAHYIAQPFPDAAFIALFYFGIAQCWLYRKTDRIWCPMLNHALFNITNLVLLFVVPE